LFSGLASALSVWVANTAILRRAISVLFVVDASNYYRCALPSYPDTAEALSGKALVARNWPGHTIRTDDELWDRFGRGVEAIRVKNPELGGRRAVVRELIRF
jgi:hypothetical protein